MNHDPALRTFKLTFPSTFHVDGPGYIQKDAVIRALRMLAPGLSLREARDLTFESGPQLVQFEIPPVTNTTNGWSFCLAMDTLAENGVVIEPCDETESESRVKFDLAPESIAADIRVMVVNSMKRKEYDTAKALIELLKNLDKI